MLAAHQQENLAHAHLTAAAAKSLAAGNKALGAKTPNNKAPKTPFKVPLNDENAYRAGKSVLRTAGKGNENVMMTMKKKGGELEKNAFVTPAGPRNRAPLGMKTTNVKTKAFLTPAPVMAQPPSATTQLKSRSPRLRRPKVKVHQESEEEANMNNEDEPEIEYMPPRGQPMPDHPEDFPPDLNLSMFEGRNFSRGLYSTYIDPEDEHGVPRSDREDARKLAEASKNIDELLERACEASFQESLDGLQELREQMRSSDQESHVSEKPQASQMPALGKRAPGTIMSRSAAAALSSTGKANSQVTTPAADAKRRLPISKASGKPSTTAPSKSNARIHAVATAAAKSTLGYSNGRAVSTSFRPTLASVSQGPPPLRNTSTMSSKCPNIAPKRSVASSTKPANSHAASNGARPQPRHGAKENKENYVKSSLQEETDLIKKLQMQALEGDDDLASTDDLMSAFSSDRLLLGEDAFEEFRFDIPEL